MLGLEPRRHTANMELTGIPNFDEIDLKIGDAKTVMKEEECKVQSGK
jgi:hypothetical protein